MAGHAVAQAAFHRYHPHRKCYLQGATVPLDQLPTNDLFLLLTNSLTHPLDMAALSEERTLASVPTQ